MATISNFGRRFLGGSSSNTLTLGSTPTTGNPCCVGVRYRPSVATLNSVVTAGGTGSDTLTAVPGGTIGETSQYSGFKIFYHQSLGAGRTGITANLSAAANSEVTFWEIAGLANLTPDLTYNPFPGGTSTSAVSGTSGSLAAAVEAAFVFGDDEDSFKTGSTPFSAGAWNWDATSPDTGSAYGSQVTAATTGLATTIDQQSGSFLCEFLVVSFYAGAAPVALRRLPILGAGR